MSDDPPRVWVGCLGCYNADVLAGKWFDAEDAPEEMPEWDKALGVEPIEQVEPWERGEDAYSTLPRKKRPNVSDEHGDPVYGPHEELWVMDHDNFHGLLDGECSPGTAKKIAEALSGIDDMDVFDAYMSISSPSEFDTPEDAVEAARDRYMAQGDSDYDAAYEYLNDTGYFEDLPKRYETHEWAIVKDWFHGNENGGAIHSVHHCGTTYLFSND